MITVDYKLLVEKATLARSRAYAPYSRFSVGAAVLGASGTIYYGCNIENAAYPMTICAERAALAAAWSAGEREFVALAVIADTEGPVSPCGMCRQVMFELMPDTPVMLANLGERRQLTTPRDLLPGAFSPSDVSGR